MGQEITKPIEIIAAPVIAVPKAVVKIAKGENVGKTLVNAGKEIIAVPAAIAGAGVSAVMAPANFISDVARGRNVAEAAGSALVAPISGAASTYMHVQQGGNIAEGIARPAKKILKKKRLRVIVLDSSKGRGALGKWWDAGSHLAKLSDEFKIIRGKSWDQVARALLKLEFINEVQFWGHGSPGSAFIGEDRLNESSLSSEAWRNLAEGNVFAPNALFWFRTCSTFNEDVGRSFAEALSLQLNVRVAGHTKYIHSVHEGLVSIQTPGGQAQWADGENSDWCFGSDLSHHTLCN